LVPAGAALFSMDANTFANPVVQELDDECSIRAGGRLGWAEAVELAFRFAVDHSHIVHVREYRGLFHISGLEPDQLVSLGG